MHSCHMLDYLHIYIRIHQAGAGTELNTCTRQWSMFRNTTDMQHTIPLTNSAIYTQQCISTLSQGIHTHPTHVHTHTHCNTHTHSHAHTCTNTDAPAHTQYHTRLHTCAHAHTCSHTYTHIHAHVRTPCFLQWTHMHERHA